MRKIIIMIPIVILCGCFISRPELKKGSLKPCYQWDLCRYYNSKIKDEKLKKDCSGFRDLCIKYMTYVDCNDTKFRSKEHKFQECWDKLK